MRQPSCSELPMYEPSTLIDWLVDWATHQVLAWPGVRSWLSQEASDSRHWHHVLRQAGAHHVQAARSLCSSAERRAAAAPRDIEAHWLYYYRHLASFQPVGAATRSLAHERSHFGHESTHCHESAHRDLGSERVRHGGANWKRNGSLDSVGAWPRRCGPKCLPARCNVAVVVLLLIGVS